MSEGPTKGLSPNGGVVYSLSRRNATGHRLIGTTEKCYPDKRRTNFEDHPRVGLGAVPVS